MKLFDESLLINQGIALRNNSIDVIINLLKQAKVDKLLYEEIKLFNKPDVDRFIKNVNKDVNIIVDNRITKMTTELIKFLKYVETIPYLAKLSLYNKQKETK